MSDIDREDLKQEERARLVNDSEPSAQQIAEKKKKKKKILFGAIILLVIIGVILAIVLPLTLKKGGGGGDDDNGFNPIDSQEYNDLAVEEDSITTTVFNQRFLLKSKSALKSKAQNFMAYQDDDDHKNTDYRPVNPKDIPIG